MRREQKYFFKELSLGTCYYPEHWDQSLWQSDLERMKDAGINTVRIGEFAWNLVEKSDGVFDFSFFDSFLDLAEKENIKVIFGTPTATPPVWLTEKYPEVLNSTKEGVLFRHGLRRHYNYNSPVYLKYCDRIVTKLAEHYAKRSCIIGWQIDNELNCEVNEFYSKSDTLAFRKWLEDKYKTLDNLNKAWGTIVWNQTYNDWNEIYVPLPTVQGNTNPHQMLDYYRFISFSTIRFCRRQSDILRKYIKKGDFITTNGMFAHVDNHQMMDEALDIYCYDSYPDFAYAMDQVNFDRNDLNDRWWSRNLSEVRSICPNFGIMEQQSGAIGWNTRMEAPAPKPGQLLLWTMQSIAHGSDYVSYFRWRTAPMGTEIYWHGILDYDNKDNRKLYEVKDVNVKVNNLKEIVNSKYKANVAILRDYDNNYDAEYDVWHKRLMWPSENAIFKSCQLTHTPVDFVYVTSDTDYKDLTPYSVIFYPHPVITDRRTVDILSEYVKEGGILILGARSGMKDKNGQCPMTSMPGELAALSKTRVKDYTFVGPADGKVMMKWNSKTLDTGVFNDILEAEGASSKVIATYADNYYKGSPCLVESLIGYGKVLHFGGSFTEDNVREFLTYTECINPYGNIVYLPECVELAVREKNGYKYMFLLNYSPEPARITLKSEVMDMDTLHKEGDLVTLDPYGVKVYRF